MHTVTVSIQGDVSVSESVQVEDTEALPLFIRLKAILHSGDALQPAKRRGRPRKDRSAVEHAEHEHLAEEADIVAEPAGA